MALKCTVVRVGTCDRQTDGETDGQTEGRIAVSLVSTPQAGS